MKLKAFCTITAVSALSLVACKNNNTSSIEAVPVATYPVDTVWVLNIEKSVGEIRQIKPTVNARLGNKFGKIYTEDCFVEDDYILYGANVGDKLIIGDDDSGHQNADKIRVIRNLSEEARLQKFIAEKQK